MILSHPHRDHVQLLPDVLSTYTVMNVWHFGSAPDLALIAHSFASSATGTSRTMMLTAPRVRMSCPSTASRAAGPDGIVQTMTIPHSEHLRRLEPVALGPSARMTFLTDDAAQHASFNQNSLVMLLELGAARISVRWAMPRPEVERTRRRRRRRSPSKVSSSSAARRRLRSDVLVVGYDGSKTSSRRAFVTATGKMSSSSCHRGADQVR